MTTDQIAERFQGRRIGNGYTARCVGPLHEHGDRHPSLRIAEGCDGRTLIRCFAGCDVADILAAAGLRLSDLFTTPASGKPRDEIPEDIAAALAALPKRLTKRERVLAATIITCNTKTLDAAIARGLALATEGEIVQLVLREER